MTTDLSNLRLVTPRLVLREFTFDDVDAVQVWAGDPEVCRLLTWGPNTVNDTRGFLARTAAERACAPRRHFELSIEHEGVLVGVGGVRVQSEANRAGDLGYVLRCERWGQGIGAEAACALRDFGRNVLGLHRIWATCDVENHASARVLEKIGMLREGRLHHDVIRQGQWRDSFIYAWVDD